MPTKTSRILGYLPQSFLPDRHRSALRAVVSPVGGELQQGEIALARILRAHWVDSADEGQALIDDLERIGSMYGLFPLRDRDGSQLQTVEQFRLHLKRYVRTLLEGRVTVRGLLNTAAEILGVSIDTEEADFWWHRPSSVLVTTEARGEDAAPLLFGQPAVEDRGADARPATVTGTVDLSGGADLESHPRLKLQVDDRSFVIDLADGHADPRAVPLAAIVESINTTFQAPVASHDGRFLTLRSITTGPSGRLELEDIDGDAAPVILGIPAHVHTGQDARPAEARAAVDLSGGDDLRRDRFLRLVVDGTMKGEIDCAGPRPEVTLLDQIRDAINEALGSDVASHDARFLTLRSPTIGSAGSVFIQEPAAQDAARRILGTPARFFLGSDARPATATSTRDLSAPVDLSERALLKVRLDASPAVTIDCAGEDPAKTTVEEIVERIDAALGPGSARTDGRYVTLTSRTVGRRGQIIFERADERDALQDVFGFGPRVFTGAAAVPASITSPVDLSDGADVSSSNRLGFILDGEPLKEIVLPVPAAGEMLQGLENGTPPDRVRRTSLNDIVAAINAAAGKTVASRLERQLVITSTESGAHSRVAIVPLEREVRRRFVSRAAIQDEAARALLGFSARRATGVEGTRAVVRGSADLQFGVDLREERWLNVSVDTGPSVEIDCAGPRPRTTTIEEAAAMIEAKLGSGIVSHDGKRLTLVSPSTGASSRIAFHPVRVHDAMDLLLDVEPQEVRGRDAGRVTFVSTVDLSKGIELESDARVKLGVDGTAAVDVSLNGGSEAVRRTLGELVTAINGTLQATVASHDGRFLILSSRQRGAASTLEFAVPGGTDVTARIFGINAPRSYQADDAASAAIVGQEPLPSEVDLSVARFLRIGVDGGAPKIVDCAARASDPAELSRMPIEKVRESINIGVSGVAHLEDGRLVLRSPTTGSASRLTLEAHVAGDARRRLFGDVPPQSTGADPQPAEIIGELQVISPLNLDVHRTLRLEIDGGRPFDIDVAGPTPAQTRLDEVIDAINAAVPGTASATLDRQLRLMSPRAGADSTLAVLPRRYIEVSEFPPVPERFATDLVGHGDPISVRNGGIAESTATVEIESVYGTVGPALVNHSAGKKIAIDIVLRPGERALIEVVAASGAVRVSHLSPDAPAVVLGADRVHLEDVGPRRAGGLLELPRGTTHWTFLECTGPRFDSTPFDEERYPDGDCRTVGMFDIGRLDGRGGRERSIFAPVPLPPASARLVFRWHRYQGGAFDLSLPAELPPLFGGRFNDARLGIGTAPQPEAPGAVRSARAAAEDVRVAKREVYEGVVFEPPADADYILARLGGLRLFEVSDVLKNVPLGYVPNVVPFRKPRFFTLGNERQEAKLYLVEEASGAVIELKAGAVGAWGNQISVAVRPDGPGRYQLEIEFPGDRFESARQAVLGRRDETETREAPGVLQAKAAGVGARVIRERTQQSS